MRKPKVKSGSGIVNGSRAIPQIGLRFTDKNTCPHLVEFNSHHLHDKVARRWLVSVAIRTLNVVATSLAVYCNSHRCGGREKDGEDGEVGKMGKGPRVWRLPTNAIATTANMVHEVVVRRFVDD